MYIISEEVGTSHVHIQNAGVTYIYIFFYDGYFSSSELFQQVQTGAS